MKVKNHAKPKNAEETLEHRKLFAFILEKMTVERKIERICLMLDCQNALYTNVVSS